MPKQINKIGVKFFAIAVNKLLDYNKHETNKIKKDAQISFRMETNR